METIKISIKGVAPLLMHSSRLANPLDPLVKSMKAITSLRKKTDQHIEELARLEFLGGLWLAGNKPCLPSTALEATFKAGAKTRKLGKDADRGLFVYEDAPLKYSGPANPDDLWKQRETFALTCQAKIQKATVMRTRPMFKEWSASFEVEFDPTVFTNAEIVMDIWKDAGKQGIGDWRPKFGRFTVL